LLFIITAIYTQNEAFAGLPPNNKRNEKE
jgi:hypothetical protein